MNYKENKLKIIQPMKIEINCTFQSLGNSIEVKICFEGNFCVFWLINRPTGIELTTQSKFLESLKIKVEFSEFRMIGRKSWKIPLSGYKRNQFFPLKQQQNKQQSRNDGNINKSENNDQKGIKYKTKW